MENLHRRAFTLVEILIVVVILGILAMMVVPRVINASEKSKASNTLTTLHTIREQILVYQAHHKQTLPTLAQLQNNWGVLMNKTDDAGTIGGGNLGPYLKVAPKNPYNNSSTVAAPGAGTASTGWEYDASTGTLTAVGFNESTETYTAPSGSSSKKTTPSRPPVVSPL